MKSLPDLRWTTDVDVDILVPEFAERLVAGLNDQRISEFTYILVGGRSLAKQQYLYDRWIAYSADPVQWKLLHPGEEIPNLAAVPGTSNHGRGLAVDLILSPSHDDQIARSLVAVVLAEYGLWQAVRDSQGRILEWWHFEQDPNRVPLSPPLSTPPNETEEEQDMPMQPLARIFSDRPDEAQFVRFASGAVCHVGSAEASLFDEGGPYASVPRVIEHDRPSYFQLVRESSTRWRPADYRE